MSKPFRFCKPAKVTKSDAENGDILWATNCPSCGKRLSTKPEPVNYLGYLLAGIPNGILFEHRYMEKTDSWNPFEAFFYTPKIFNENYRSWHCIQCHNSFVSESGE